MNRLDSRDIAITHDSQRLGLEKLFDDMRGCSDQVDVFRNRLHALLVPELHLQGEEPSDSDEADSAGFAAPNAISEAEFNRVLFGLDVGCSHDIPGTCDFC